MRTYRTGLGRRLNGLAEWITPPLARTDQAAMAALRAFLRTSYALYLTAETRGWLGVVSAQGLEIHG